MEFSLDTQVFQNFFRRRQLRELIGEMERPAHPGELPQRIERCTQALSQITQLGMPGEWAVLHFLLATFWERRVGPESSDGQERAIHHYEQALKVFTRLQAPKQWAAAQAALGNLYNCRHGGERAANQEQAIFHAQQALMVFTRENSPEDWSAANFVLANAFQERIGGNREENEERSVFHAEQALSVLPPDNGLPRRGLSYLMLAHAWATRRTGISEENERRALHYCELALAAIDPKESPAHWAMAQTALGDIYSRCGGAERIRQAIGCYELALSLLGAETPPRYRAEVQLSLACLRAEAQTAPRDYEEVLGLAEQALGVLRKEDISGEGHCRAAELLGLLLFRARRWAGAAMAFSEALSIREARYRASVGDRGKQSELYEAGNLPLRQAYVLARCGQLTRAVEVLEGGRARALSESLRREPEELAHIRPGDRRAYRQAVERIGALQAEQRRDSARGYLITTIDLRAAYGALEEVVTRIREYRPTFLREPEFEVIRRAATINYPLAYLLTTEVGGLALFVTARGELRALWGDDFTETHLNELLYPEADGVSYLEGAVGGDREALDHSLEKTLRPLGEALMRPLAAALEAEAAMGVTLVPCGRLALLPLHAAPYGDDRLLDHFDVAYIPSTQVGINALRKVTERRTRGAVLAGVSDPDRTLPFARSELECVEGLARAHGGQTRVLAHEAATLKALSDILPGATHIHFSCHGRFDPSEPLEATLWLADAAPLTLRAVLDDPSLRRVKDARLVVMSACQTAIIDFSSLPDESIGLPSGFLQAGVPGVIGTLWPVADASTALLIVRFYELLFGGDLPPAAALRRAQCWLRDSTDEDLAAFCGRYEPLNSLGRQFRTRNLTCEGAASDEPDARPAARPYAKPYYWAGFVFYGR